MTDDELLAAARAFVAKWQPRLRIADWRIETCVKPFAEDGGADWGARVSIIWRERKAVVAIPPDWLERHRADRDYDQLMTPEDILEHAVVHELLHVVESPGSNRLDCEIDWITGKGSLLTQPLTDAWRDYREVWINQLATVLIEADRGAWDDEAAGDGVIGPDDPIFNIVGLGSSATADAGG